MACVKCEKTRQLICAGCNEAGYCSIECQKNDWEPKHRQQCFKAVSATHPFAQHAAIQSLIDSGHTSVVRTAGDKVLIRRPLHDFLSMYIQGKPGGEPQKPKQGQKRVSDSGGPVAKRVVNAVEQISFLSLPSTTVAELLLSVPFMQVMDLHRNPSTTSMIVRVLDEETARNMFFGAYNLETMASLVRKPGMTDEEERSLVWRISNSGPADVAFMKAFYAYVEWKETVKAADKAPGSPGTEQVAVPPPVYSRSQMLLVLIMLRMAVHSNPASILFADKSPPAHPLAALAGTTLITPGFIPALMEDTVMYPRFREVPMPDHHPPQTPLEFISRVAVVDTDWPELAVPLMSMYSNEVVRPTSGLTDPRYNWRTKAILPLLALRAQAYKSFDACFRQLDAPTSLVFWTTVDADFPSSLVPWDSLRRLMAWGSGQTHPWRSVGRALTALFLKSREFSSDDDLLIAHFFAPYPSVLIRTSLAIGAIIRNDLQSFTFWATTDVLQHPLNGLQAATAIIRFQRSDFLPLIPSILIALRLTALSKAALFKEMCLRDYVPFLQCVEIVMPELLRGQIQVDDRKGTAVEVALQFDAWNVARALLDLREVTRDLLVYELDNLADRSELRGLPVVEGLNL